MDEEMDILSQSIELLIDQLHYLSQEGDMQDAEALADRIRELNLL